MDADFLLCDVCGKKLAKENRLFVALDNRMDAAGSNETVGEYVDLCEGHSIHLLKFLLKEDFRKVTNLERKS